MDDFTQNAQFLNFIAVCNYTDYVVFLVPT